MLQTVKTWKETITSPAGRAPAEAMAAVPGGQNAAGESLAEVAHDARNMVTALALYCDLLEEPGVLAHPFLHYGNDLRIVTAASKRLVEKLAALLASQPRASASNRPVPGSIASLAEELLVNRNLLAALAGPAVSVEVEAEGGAQPVAISAEDLTRVMVNLVKNAAEAMPQGGHVRIRLTEREAEGEDAARLVMAVEDDGPGIPESAFESIFTEGYTTHGFSSADGNGGWVWQRGLGLVVSRTLIEAAGGTLRAVRRDEPGACFEIVLPVRRESDVFKACRGLAFAVS